MPHSSKDLSNERTRDMRHSLFGSNDEYSDEYYYSSPRSTRAPSHERVNDGVRCRHIGTRGFGKDTTSKRNEPKPWRLPEHLNKSLSNETSQHNQIPLFDARELHDLSSSVKNFRAKEDFISMLSSSINGTTVTKSATRHRFWQR